MLKNYTKFDFEMGMEGFESRKLPSSVELSMIGV